MVGALEQNPREARPWAKASTCEHNLPIEVDTMKRSLAATADKRLPACDKESLSLVLRDPGLVGHSQGRDRRELHDVMMQPQLPGATG